MYLAERIINIFKKIAAKKLQADITTSSTKKNPDAKKLKPRALKLTYKKINKIYIILQTENSADFNIYN